MKLFSRAESGTSLRMVGMGPAIVLLVSLGAAPMAKLHYEVRPGLSQCPDEQWVRSAVAGRLGRDPFSPDAVTAVRARIDSAQEGGLTALVEVERADGTTGRRSLDSPAGDCLELASAVELAITLAIEPLWLTKKPEPPAPPQPAPVEARGRVGLLASVGGAPGFTAGVAAGGGVAWPRFALSLEGRVLLPSGVTFAGERAATFSALGSLLPCLRVGRFSACGVATVGVFQVESTIPGVPRTTTLMAQAGVRGTVDFELTRRLVLVPWLEAAVVLTRTSLVSGTSTLWVTSPLSVTAGLSVELHFSS